MISKLTPQQQKVADLVVHGYSAKEIGIILKISNRTIEVHKSETFRKLGVRNAIELVHYYYYHNLIPGFQRVETKGRRWK